MTTVPLPTAVAQLRTWSARRWLTSGAAAIGFGLLVAVPTDLVDTPLFSREIPPTWWSWPALAVSAVLTGLVVASYVDATASAERREGRRGWLGGVLTFFAVGCPVCNKLVLVLLGTSGALTWFEPLQPLIQLAAVLLLGWALLTRLRGEVACALASAPPSSTPTEPGVLRA